MVPLKEKLNNDLKDALKNKDEIRVSVLRMVLAAISNKEIDTRKKDVGLSDEEVAEILSKEAKKRREAIEGFRKGGRDDSAAREKAELEVVSAYLPEEMSDEDVLRIVKDGVREAGAAGVEDFGKAMKIVMQTLKGKADGERISKILREVLAAGSE